LIRKIGTKVLSYSVKVWTGIEEVCTSLTQNALLVASKQQKERFSSELARLSGNEL